MAKRTAFITVVILLLIPYIYPWESQLFPFNGGTGRYQAVPVSFNSGTWQLLDYSYVGYNLGQTPLQTGIPCNVLTVTGTGDITQEIQDKINTVGAAGGGIVKIPAGTYTITQTSAGKTICINYNNVSVEGAGSGYTILNVPATHSYNEDANAFEGTFTIEKNYFAWSKGWTDPSATLCTIGNKINAGDTYITGLTDLTAVNTGDWVLIIQYFWPALIADNGGTGTWTACPPTCGGNPGREYAFSYLRKITAKDANGITVDAPIPYSLDPANNPINIKPGGPVNGPMVNNCGVSGMTIRFADNNNSVTSSLPSGCAVYFQGALNCWVKDLYIDNFPRYGINVEYSARVSVEDTTIEKAQNYGGGGNGYGFFTTCSQNVLYKNCTGISARHNFIVSRAITSYVVMTHCRSIDSREGEDSHFSLAHAILRDDYYQSNGNDLNGYNRGSTSSGAYESFLSGALWNFSGDGYAGLYYGGTVNITPSPDGSAIIIGGPGFHTVYDGSYYDAGGAYHPGDIMALNPSLQVGPGPNGTRKNVLYEGLGSTGLSPQSLYETQLENRVGSVAQWANICGDAATMTPVPTNTPVLTPGILVYDSDHPAWGAGFGGSAPTMLNTLTPGNNLDDRGENRTINGARSMRFTSTGSDWGILMQFGGPDITTSSINKLDFWIYPTTAALNFRLQLMNKAADLGSSLIVTGAMADGGTFTINTWNHVAIPIASFGYSGTFNGLDLRNNTATAGNTFWMDDIYFIQNATPTFTFTASPSYTFSRTATFTPGMTSSFTFSATYSRTPTDTITASPANTFTASPTFTVQPPTNTLTPTPGKWGACGKILLAYYYNDGTNPYNASKIPYNQLTHIAHSFIVPNADGSLNIPANFIEPALISKAHAAGVKVVISTGGGGTYAQYSAMADNAAARGVFEDNMVNFIKSNGYDGIDIDYEGPENGVDTANYTLLMGELRAKFNAAQPAGQNWLITAAVGGSNYSGQWIDYASILPYVDYFNLMNYEMGGSWNDHMSHNAPLYAGTDPYPDLNCAAAVDYIVTTRGVPASKVIFGTPFYGYEYTNIENLYDSCPGSCGAANVIYLDYKVIAATYQTAGSGWTYHWDAGSLVPYLTKDSGAGIITFDDPASIADKVNYALAVRNLAGVMMWDLNADYIPWQGQPLMDSMFNAFTQACPSGYTATPTFTITPTYTITPVWPTTIIYDGDTAGSRLQDGTVTNSTNGGGLTETTGGNGGNGMVVTYTDTAWYTAQEWQPNAPKTAAGYNYLQFDIKAVSGFVDGLELELDWGKGVVSVMNYAPQGIPPYWETIDIPLSALLASGTTQVNMLDWIKTVNYPYTVMIDNVKLVNMTVPTPTLTATPFTPSATATAAGTASYTATYSYTPTATLTAFNTQTQTNTVTQPATATMTWTPAAGTYTVTPSLTPTRTPTPSNTVQSFTETPSFTYTITLTPSITATQVISATITETPALPPAGTELFYPNPFNPDVNDLHIFEYITYDAPEFLLRIYTPAFRLVREINLGAAPHGGCVLTAERGFFNGLSNGIYFCTIKTYSQVKSEVLKAQKLILLK